MCLSICYVRLYCTVLHIACVQLCRALESSAKSLQAREQQWMQMLDPRPVIAALSLCGRKKMRLAMAMTLKDNFGSERVPAGWKQTVSLPSSMSLSDVFALWSWRGRLAGMPGSCPKVS